MEGEIVVCLLFAPSVCHKSCKVAFSCKCLEWAHVARGMHKVHSMGKLNVMIQDFIRRAF
jgi:hypothetical protein